MITLTEVVYGMMRVNMNVLRYIQTVSSSACLMIKQRVEKKISKNEAQTYDLNLITVVHHFLFGLKHITCIFHYRSRY